MTRAVLVVDDDRFIRRLVATTLQDVSKFKLHQAADGFQALALARDIQPAIVFLDVEMPGMDGIDACRRLRSDPTTRAATIVMLTAALRESTERMALQAGADLFLTKPFSPLELLRLVDRLGAEPNSGNPDQHDRVDHEQHREADRPAVEVALDQ